MTKIEKDKLWRLLGIMGSPNCQGLHHKGKHKHLPQSLCPAEEEAGSLIRSLLDNETDE